MENPWVRKFQHAIRGVFLGVVGQNSFMVHGVATLLVILVALVLRCQAWHWCALWLSIGLVWTAELLNSAIEELARGLCREHNRQVGQALDIAAGAVLIASLTAIIIGCIALISAFRAT